jgi:hypothetical protein
VPTGLEGDDLVSGHLSRRAKLRNIGRDPRVVLSFDAPRVPGVFLNEYAMLRYSVERIGGVGPWASASH